MSPNPTQVPRVALNIDIELSHTGSHWGGPLAAELRIMYEAKAHQNPPGGAVHSVYIGDSPDKVKQNLVPVLRRLLR